MKKKNNVTSFFGKNKQNVIPINNGKTSINVDISSLPDVNCIKCGEEYFINVTKIKKLSKTISPDGREGNVNINMLKCSKCGWLFNPKEWQKEFDELEKKVYEDSGNFESKEEEPVEEIDEKTALCRKCGEFYEEGTEHTCKPI
jgi:DNA-directed RNA polymerase subunit M/transcription elongation factor TFIIS